MAITAEERTSVVSLLVGMFDAAPTGEILKAFVNRLEAGESVTDIANDMDDHELFEMTYPDWISDALFAERFTTTLLDGNASAADLATAITAVEGILNNGYSRGATIEIAVNYLMALEDTTSGWYDAAVALRNKVEVAEYFADNLLGADTDLASLQAVIADIDATQDSVDDQKSLIDLGVSSEDDFDFKLTVNQDDIEGTAGNDTISAWIFDNQNTAQSGDMIDGNGGDDTLVAEIGASQNFAISLKTTSVENAFFRAQAAASDSADNDIQDEGAGGDDGIDENTQIDAQDMNGTSAFWSLDSRANLVIEDVRNNSHETTLGWRQADAGSVNYEVYFDTHHITGPGAESSGSQLFIEIMDIQSMDDTAGAEPLGGNIYNLLQFTLDGETKTLGNATTPAVTTTYDALVSGIQALLDAEGLDITASIGSSFTVNSADSGNTWSGSQIVLTANDDAVLGAGGWGTTGFTPADSNFHTAMDTEAPVTTTFLDEVNIIFDDVGRGSKAADFVAGNISQGENSGSKGIQLFDIEVQRNSWVDTVRTTNNWLEEVEIENGTGYTGSLRIDDLNDVRRVDASTMTGAVILDVDLSDDTITKFLDLDDVNDQPDADNVSFTYTMGTSNDTLNLSINQELAAHEDSVFSVDGGSGNDTLIVSFTDGDAVTNDGVLDDNWYADQHTLKGVSISGGAGDDTITAYGEGDTTIDAGAGNDTVYTDNSGVQTGLTLDDDNDDGILDANDSSKAAWVFNATDPRLTDLAGAALTTQWLYGATVTVTFSGATTAGGGVSAGTAVALDKGIESSVTIDVTDYMGSQAEVNQAIKQAINSDATLSKLLYAYDGADNTLVVQSLVDGTFANDDLLVDITAATWANYSAAEQTTLNNAFNLIVKDSDTDLSQATLDAAVTAIETASASYVTAVQAQDEAATAIVGAASAVASDNTVKVGTGNDVVVLGTLEGADEIGSDNDIVFFAGTDIGDNTILNFDQDGNGIDQLDFTSILDTIVRTSASNSSASQAVADITYSADATLTTNEVLAVDFTATVTDTWANLTATELLDALNGDGNYANLTGATAASDNGAARFGTDDTDVAETSQDHLLLVQNTANDGEYKVFHLTSVSDSAATVDTGDFATAVELGEIDFADGVTFATGLFV